MVGRRFDATPPAAWLPTALLVAALVLSGFACTGCTDVFGRDEAAKREGRSVKYPACPACGSNEDCVPIVYGLPEEGGELERMAARGEVVLGGCVIEPDSPSYRCTSCGEDFAAD